MQRVSPRRFARPFVTHGQGQRSQAFALHTIVAPTTKGQGAMVTTMQRLVRRMAAWAGIGGLVLLTGCAGTIKLLSLIHI